MTTYTDVFGGDTLPPSEFGYQALSITSNTTLVWPYNSTGGTAVSKIMDVSATAGLSLTLPDATQVSTGEDFLIRNTGAESITIKDAGGSTISTVAAGAAKYFYLTSNSTAAGTWGVIAYGVGTSSVDAASLVGYGIIASGATLNQSHPIFTTASGITVDSTRRATVINFTGGADTLALTSAVTLGDNFFFLLRNSGTGTLTINPDGTETVDGVATLDIQPGESLMLFCSGAAWYTVGYGRSILFNFTQLVLDVSAAGTFTLTASEASNKLLTFTGNPAGAVTVVVPNTVAVYYILSSISTAQSITVKTAAGTGVAVPQSQRVIAICDSTNVYSAQSVSASTTVTIVDGSVSSPSLAFASQTNTGIYKFSTNGLGIAVNGTDVTSFLTTQVAFYTNKVTVDSSGNLTVAGDITLSGAGKGIVFEGTTADANETTLIAGEPTADRTITLPDSTTTLAGLATAQTFSALQTFSAGLALSGSASNIATGSNYISNGGTDAGLSFDGSNNATFSAGVTGSTFNKLTLTAPATGATLTLTDGKTFSVSNTLTLAGTDGTTMTFPSTSATLARTDAANTFTGTQTIGALVATTVNGNTISTGTGTLTLGAGSTLVTSATNSITLTSTGATNVTLPTAGTLATLAGTEELTNKTLNASVAKGTWTASGAWTIPAVTLGGAVTGNSQNISGLGTLGCGAITTSATQTINTPANATAINIVGRSGANQNESWVFFYRNDGTTLQGGILGSNNVGLSLAGPDGNTKLEVTNAALTTGSGITSLAFSAGNPSLNIGTGALTCGAITSSGDSVFTAAVYQPMTLRRPSTGVMELRLQSQNASAAYVSYGAIRNEITDTTAGSEDGGVSIHTMAAGSQAQTYTFLAGSFTTAASVTSLAFNAGNPSLTIGTGALTAGEALLRGASSYGAAFAVSVANGYAIGWGAKDYLAGNSTSHVLTAVCDNATIGTFSSTGLSVNGYYEGTEQTAPAAPAANGYRIFAEDNGAGKTRLMVQFATGAAQQIAIEP